MLNLWIWAIGITGIMLALAIEGFAPEGADVNGLGNIVTAAMAIYLLVRHLADRRSTRD